MPRCPVCEREHDGEESVKAIRFDGSMELDLGAVCSLPCVAEMIQRLDPVISESTCPGCPNCKPMSFARPSGMIS